MEGSGYNSQQIAEALNQVGIKSNIEQGSSQQNSMQPSLIDEEVPAPPQPDQQSQSYQPQSKQQFVSYSPQSIAVGQDSSDMQSLIESIVEERVQRISDNMTDFEIWRSRMNDDLISIKQEIVRISTRFDSMQKVVLGKVDEYGKSVTDVTSEIKALEKVFQNIISPLTSNIKDLSRITEEMKKRS